MDMEVVRLVNTSWLRIPDRQVVAMRAAMLSADRSPIRPATWAAVAAVPDLNWPRTLFEDGPSEL